MIRNILLFKRVPKNLNPYNLEIFCLSISDNYIAIQLASVSEMYNSFVFLILFVISNGYSNAISTCNQDDTISTYLDVSLLLLSKARLNIKTGHNSLEKTRDCWDVLQMGKNKSGVYEIWPMNRLTEDKFIKVYCDMDTDGGGWTVIQRRGNFTRSKDYFFQDWKNYKDGFGHVEKDFWLGNDNIFALTNQKLYSVRFDLKDFEKNTSYALYDEFWVDGERNNYTLHISQYSGDAGDSMTYHNNVQFSTRDCDNDRDDSRNCASLYKGGWWYNACYKANLNGLFYASFRESSSDGIAWQTWRPETKSLAWTEIKIRPKKFAFSLA